MQIVCYNKKEIKIKTKQIQGDFMGKRDEEDPAVLHCEMRNLDTSTFSESIDFEIVCDQVEEISEFFVFTGEYDDSPIHPIQLLSVSFWTDEFGLVSISEELFQNCLQEILLLSFEASEGIHEYSKHQQD